MTTTPLKKIGKVAGLAVAALVVLALLLVGGTVTVARTSWGAERLRRMALPRLNAALAGKLEVRRFRFLGDRVLLEGLLLRDPDGELVAGAARLDVAFSPWQLLRRHLQLREVALDEPLLLFRREKGGDTNLARALTPRHPRPPAEPAAPQEDGAQRAPLTVNLERLVIRGAAVDLLDERPDAPPVARHIRLENLDAQGNGRYAAGNGGFGVNLEVHGQGVAPLRAPLSLKLESKGTYLSGASRAEGDPTLAADARVSLTVGANTVQLAGEVQSIKSAAASPSPRGTNGPGVNARLEIERVRITPALVRLFAPASPLKAPLTLSGRGTLDGASGKVATNLDLAAAGTVVAINASVDLERESIDGLSVRARGIDLGRLFEAGSPSELSFALVAHGQGRNLATLRGAATLDVPRGRLGGYTAGPIRLRVDADRGRYKLMDLKAVIPGMNVSGAGEASSSAVAFRAAVEVRDLSATVRSVMAGRAKAPRASGRGRIELALAGKPGAPALHVKGHLVGLGWQDIRVPMLDVEADVPDVRVPLAARMKLEVPQADVGTRHFRGLAFTLSAAGPRFDARLSLTAPEQLALDVAGVWGPGHDEIGFQQVVLRSRRATWRSMKPMRLVFGGEVLRVIGLDWRTDDGQQLRLELEKRPTSVRGDVALEALDLARLPESFLPPGLKLAGRLDAALHVQGRTDRTDRLIVDGKATLTEGRVGPVRDIALSTKVRLSGRRVVGELDLGALGAKVAGTFDLPVVWPPPKDAPLVADFHATNLDFQRMASGLEGARDQLAGGKTTVLIATQPPLDVRGSASGNLKLSGTGATPRLALDADVRQLTVKGKVVGDVTIAVDAPGSHPITARVELRQPQVTDRSTLAVRTGFSLGTLIHHPPSQKALLVTPMHVEARIRGVKLAPLAALAGHVGKVGGTASLEVDLDGTPQTARGKVALTLAAVSAGRFPPTDGTLHLDLGERDMRAEARVTRRSATLFSVTARVGAPVARFLGSDRAAVFADTPVELHAALGPLDLQRVGLPPETDRQPARILKGRLQAQADVTGTLRAPRVTVRADAADLRLDQTPIGAAVVLVTYANRSVAGDANLQSANGGRLHLVASAQADLGYPAIARGLDAAKVPVKARLNAQGFDLAGLSGATPGLRTVAGQLFAGVDVTGTAADPRVSGSMEWRSGALTITGMGEYKRIHFLAHGDVNHVVLDELRADSGGGNARVTASGDHRDGQGYAIKAALALDQFPAYVEGQALAALSLHARADTQVSVQRVRATVSIDSARLALSDAKRKHLQKLGPPGDVILTDGGSPLNPAQARRLAALTAALAPPAEKQARVAEAAARADNGEPAGVIVFVDAPRNLWVSGKDANVELGLQPGFRVEVTEVTRVFGEVVIKRGRVDVVGRRFDLKAASTARFSGPPDQPELDVTAQYDNEQEKITVMVTVKGSPRHLQIGITAPDRPDLTETQLYTLIVTGRLDLGGGTASATTPADRAASLVGGLVASQLQRSLSKKLPFDVLTIEAGNGLGAARLEAGTYVTSDLYVGYVGRLGADPALLQNRNAVHLEYELSSHWSFQGEYGDAKTGSADVMWTRRY